MGDSYYIGAAILGVAVNGFLHSITIGLMIFGVFCIIDGMICYLDGDKK